MLTNKHVFIGAENRIEVLSLVDGDAQLLCGDDVGSTIRKLLISPRGDHLLVLVTRPRTQELRIYPLIDFDQDPRLAPSQIVTWEARSRIHCGLTISMDGKRIALYTNECELGKSEIRFVRKFGPQWEKLGIPMEIQTLPENPEERGSDNGLTGAAM